MPEFQEKIISIYQDLADRTHQDMVTIGGEQATPDDLMGDVQASFLMIFFLKVAWREIDQQVIVVRC